jgi:hypothetical protein
MAELLYDSALGAAIEELIDNADDFLWLVSPYISLHQRIRDKLKTMARNKPHVEVIVVFGKNEDDAHKSMSKEDIEFLKQLPNIQICYEKRLHAKFYASEDAVIVTSMNLHQFSQNNNIEVGLKFDSRKRIHTAEEIDKKLLNYFDTIIDNAHEIFWKWTEKKSGFWGITSKSEKAIIQVDETEVFFRQKDFSGKARKFYKNERSVGLGNPNGEKLMGYCIRTGKPIPFNPERPLCAEAYKSWSMYKNPDFKEKYCHKTGRPSNGKTSMRNPIL